MNANPTEVVPKVKKMTASAPEFIPVEVQAEKTSREAAEKVLEGEGRRRKTRKGKTRKSKKRSRKTKRR